MSPVKLVMYMTPIGDHNWKARWPVFATILVAEAERQNSHLAGVLSGCLWLLVSLTKREEIYFLM